MTTKTNAVKYNFREDKARHETIRNECGNLGRFKPIEVTNCLPGKDASNLTDDPDELALLGRAAKRFGWGNEFCTVSQAKKFFGRLDPEYKGHGWLVKYKPYTPKSGKNAGVTSQFKTVVYPKEAFLWTYGEPVFDEQLAAEKKVKNAERDVRRANRELKNARKMVQSTTAPNPANDYADVIARQQEMLEQMAKQNEKLTEALSAIMAKIA